jgi:hypothetical protein
MKKYTAMSSHFPEQPAGSLPVKQLVVISTISSAESLRCGHQKLQESSLQLGGALHVG